MKKIRKGLFFFVLFLMDLALPIGDIKFSFPFALFSEWWVLLMWGILVDGFFSRLGPGLSVALLSLSLYLLLNRLLGVSPVLSRILVWGIGIKISNYFFPAGIMVGDHYLLCGYLLGLGFRKWIEQREKI